MSIAHRSRNFATTRWSLIIKASSEEEMDHSKALAELCKIYWKPVYGFAYRQSGRAHDAEDLTQKFFLHILENNTIRHAKKDAGRFRSYLITCLKNFITKDWRDQNRLKRGGGKVFVEYDFSVENEVLNSETYRNCDPEHLFGRRWAETVIERSMQLLEKEYQNSGRPFHPLTPFLNSPKGEVPYQKVADELGISLAALKSAIYRMRNRFGELVRAEVAQTVDSPDQVESELRQLLSLLD